MEKKKENGEKEKQIQKITVEEMEKEIEEMKKQEEEESDSIIILEDKENDDEEEEESDSIIIGEPQKLERKNTDSREQYFPDPEEWLKHRLIQVQEHIRENIHKFDEGVTNITNPMIDDLVHFKPKSIKTLQEIKGMSDLRLKAFAVLILKEINPEIIWIQKMVDQYLVEYDISDAPKVRKKSLVGRVKRKSRSARKSPFRPSGTRPSPRRVSRKKVNE